MLIGERSHLSCVAKDIANLFAARDGDLKVMERGFAITFLQKQLTEARMRAGVGMSMSIASRVVFDDAIQQSDGFAKMSLRLLRILLLLVDLCQASMRRGQIASQRECLSVRGNPNDWRRVEPVGVIHFLHQLMAQWNQFFVQVLRHLQLVAS